MNYFPRVFKIPVVGKAFTGLGIRGRKAQDALQDKLADSAAEWARSIVGHTRKARKTLERGTAGEGHGQDAANARE